MNINSSRLSGKDFKNIEDKRWQHAMLLRDVKVKLNDLASDILPHERVCGDCNGGRYILTPCMGRVTHIEYKKSDYNHVTFVRCLSDDELPMHVNHTNPNIQKCVHDRMRSGTYPPFHRDDAIVRKWHKLITRHARLFTVIGTCDHILDRVFNKIAVDSDIKHKVYNFRINNRDYIWKPIGEIEERFIIKPEQKVRLITEKEIKRYE